MFSVKFLAPEKCMANLVSTTTAHEKEGPFRPVLQSGQASSRAKIRFQDSNILGLLRGYIGIMEKEMETTMV